MNNVDKELLKQVAGKDTFDGAYNIRKDGEGFERKITENLFK